jgi:diaminopimelate decarboxylase
LKLLNLGGGMGVDYTGEAAEFPLEPWAEHVRQRMRGQSFDLVMEPGRWLIAPAGVLLAEVLWVKERDGKRFVVIAAGMNDLLRPALYKARHRIEPVEPRDGQLSPAAVVGPVCESADVFAQHVELPPLEAGDLLAIRDVGAYGAAMASNYNGRGRLAELVVSGSTLMRARAGEGPEEMLRRRREDVLEG